MKKIIFTLAVLLTATVSASAQGYVMKVMNGDVEVASHRVDAVTDIVFEDYVDDFWLDGATSALQNLAYGQTVDLTPYIKGGYTVASWNLSGDTQIGEGITDSAVEISQDGLLTVNFFTDEASNGYHEMINRSVTVTATDSDGDTHTATATIDGGHFIHNFADGIGNIQIIPAESPHSPVWEQGDGFITVYLSSNGAQNMTIAHSGETAGSDSGGFMVDPTNYPIIALAVDEPISGYNAGYAYFYGSMYAYLSTGEEDGNQLTTKIDITESHRYMDSWSTYTYDFVEMGAYGPWETINGFFCFDLSTLSGLSSYKDTDGLVSLDELEFVFEGFQALDSSLSPNGALTGAAEGGNYKAYWLGTFKSTTDARNYYLNNQ